MAYSTDPFQVLHKIKNDLAHVERLIPILQEVQYLRSAPSAPGRGGVTRPTEDIALDSARLGVREELRIAESHMIEAAARVVGVRAALDRALADWESGRVTVGDRAEAV